MGRPAGNHVGARYGKLTGLRKTNDKSFGNFIWEWQCDCGNVHRALASHVLAGSTRSCGCSIINPRGIKPGDRFGRLVLIGRSELPKKWKWQCDCGNVIDRIFQPIRTGVQVSCGCYQKEVARANAKHGAWQTKTYAAWARMKARCYGVNSPEHYKFRGITVDEGWINSFEKFLADMGECPAGRTLERIRNNEGYGPDNCRWATQAEQLRNTRRTVFVMFRGIEMCLKDACAANGVNYDKVRSRIRAGMNPQEALDTP